MFEQLRKKSIKKALPVVIIVGVIGLVMIVAEFSNLISLVRGHVEFESLAPDEINGSLVVDASIAVNFGSFMEEYKSYSNSSYTRTTDVYYVIWTGDEYAQDYRYMAIKVPASYEKQMEAMAEASYNGEYSTPIQFSGAVNRLSSKEYEYFKEYFLYSGFTEEEFEEQTLPYYIDVDDLVDGSESVSTVYVITVLGLALFVAAVWMLVSALTGRKLNAIKKDLEDAGISESSASCEYEAAPVLYKNSDLRIGARLTFYLSGSKPRAIANDKMVWAYQKTTTHRTNGIKTGTTYQVVIYHFNRNAHMITVPNSEKALEVLNLIAQKMPWVVVGYDNDLNKMYQKDYQNFLDMRYNKVPHDPYADFQGIVQ